MANYETFEVNNLGTNRPFEGEGETIVADMLMFDPQGELRLCGFKSQFFVADCEGDPQRRMNMMIFDSLGDAMTFFDMMKLHGRLGYP